MTEARRDHLPWTSCAEKPGRSVSTKKPRILGSLVASADGSSTSAQMTATSGRCAGGDPHLFAVEDVVVAVFAGAGAHAAGVGAEVGFGESEAS